MAPPAAAIPFRCTSTSSTTSSASCCSSSSTNTTLTTLTTTTSPVLPLRHQFQPIVDEIAANSDPTLKFTYGVPRVVQLNYQTPPPPGKRTGRYIDQPNRGDVVDEHFAAPVQMRDGRELHPPASLESTGFALKSFPTQCTDFTDKEQVVGTYYGEMMELVKQASGAQRVFIFDHTVGSPATRPPPPRPRHDPAPPTPGCVPYSKLTGLQIRESGNTNLNASAGAATAAPVPRVHCDYTATGAPRRLLQLGEEGIYSRLRGRTLTTDDVAELAAGRFAFINVWRSIDAEHPVLQKPLALCDENSVAAAPALLLHRAAPRSLGLGLGLTLSLRLATAPPGARLRSLPLRAALPRPHR